MSQFGTHISNTCDRAAVWLPSAQHPGSPEAPVLSLPGGKSGCCSHNPGTRRADGTSVTMHEAFPFIVPTLLLRVIGI